MENAVSCSFVSFIFRCEANLKPLTISFKTEILSLSKEFRTFELAKNGAKNIKIYDGDILEEENILRWVYGGIGKRTNKATIIQLLLNQLHPEINIEVSNQNIDDKSLLEELLSKDMIIFTVGNSDEQLKFNAALKKARCTVPVIYVWLEAGGEYSHILFVNYQQSGCFECLYTNSQGEFVNNRSRKTDDLITENMMIQNGCGGTRAAYGTAVLLRTTAALLDTIRDIENLKISKNTLIDISPNKINKSDTEFPMEVCNCCGHRFV